MEIAVGVFPNTWNQAEKTGCPCKSLKTATSAVALPPAGNGSENHLMIQKINGLPGTPRGLNAVKIPGPPGSSTLLQKHNPVTGREDFGHREIRSEWMEFKRLGSI